MKSVSGKEMCKALERAGWRLIRIRSSHHIYHRVGAPRPVPVPVHGNRTLQGKLQRAIMKEAGLRESEL
jgi:predicted RNA binding protein YcfA (HicA-like mRNA interferase family)